MMFVNEWNLPDAVKSVLILTPKYFKAFGQVVFELPKYATVNTPDFIKWSLRL